MVACPGHFRLLYHILPHLALKQGTREQGTKGTKREGSQEDNGNQEFRIFGEEVESVEAEGFDGG
jgi:hypothetical protein